jgi:hypothetical protein
MVADLEIGDVVSRRLKAEEAVSELIDLAKQRGAPDNVTAVLLTVVRRAGGGFRRLLFTAVILSGLALAAGGLALGTLTKDREKEKTTAAEPTSEPEISSSDSPELSAPRLPSSPLDVVISPLELIWPTESTPLVVGDHITFAWKWESEVKAQDGRFILALQTSEEAEPFLREVLPLTQSQFELSQSLKPGKYLWTMSVSGIEERGVSSGRLFAIVEPTPNAIGSPLAQPGRQD